MDGETWADTSTGKKENEKEQGNDDGGHNDNGNGGFDGGHSDSDDGGFDGDNSDIIIIEGDTWVDASTGKKENKKEQGNNDGDHNDNGDNGFDDGHIDSDDGGFNGDNNNIIIGSNP
uniref:Nacrein-like protein P1 n=1 Tax=Cicer arietinum TaxID=3827 RepID=A0A1S3EDE5_CICAR|nr:nacrein-like protein P1 [Cicer arietinum]